MSAPNEWQLTGRHVLVAAISFFGVVIFANLVLFYLAMESWTGLSEEDSYQRGLAYNERLREAEAQQKLGWRVEAALEVLGQGRQRLVVHFADAAGRPPALQSLEAEMRRPTDSDLDQLLMLEKAAPGRYEAPLALPLAGQWELRLTARAPGGEIYRLEQRLWLEEGS